MSASANDIGVVGMGVMGRNLALNIADHGFAVAVYNRTGSVTREFVSSLVPEQRVRPCYSLEELVAALTVPRGILVMVEAGPPVDAVLEELQSLLQPGDVAMDGGNSHFRDTERRGAALAEKGIGFLGVGVSGGEAGARTGPSLMPGGPPEAYEAVRVILEAIAARVDGRPCVSYLGRGGAGHYVKMVHNGIEYGFMQLIAEAYALMSDVLGLDNDQCAAFFADWNDAELESYLVDITAQILRRRDERTGGYLVDVVRGEAGQLGTGMWASESATRLRVPVPNIDIAVAMRNLSALAEQRAEASRLYGAGARGANASAQASQPCDDGPAIGRLGAENVRNALYAAMIVTHAQGFAQLQTASEAFGYQLKLQDIASIWQGGCIIRSKLLHDIEAAFERRPASPNLLLDAQLSGAVSERRGDLVQAVQEAAVRAVPAPGLMTALSYLDSYGAECLPFNLIQAQRDYFGAHEYRRTDEEGVFHTEWSAGEDGS
ncbi:MAG: NADP-dependent phosphogluconate dehydrogenase [Thermoleophilia bacterium]|nr:NADP-dependent phosphogluconate dehydrogenase [Thermoleophilia bacterium]